MNFRQATDELIASVTLGDLAKALGVHVQAVRQARVSEDSPGHRSPPEGWEKAVRQLAAGQAKRLEGLQRSLKSPNKAL